jgi:hypothetical protein
LTIQWLKILQAPDAVTNDDGDGTVNLRSLEVCITAGPEDATSTVVIQNATHLGVISKAPLLKALQSALELDHQGCAAAMQAAVDAAHAAAKEIQPSGVLHWWQESLSSWMASDHRSVLMQSAL